MHHVPSSRQAAVTEANLPVKAFNYASTELVPTHLEGNKSETEKMKITELVWIVCLLLDF